MKRSFNSLRKMDLKKHPSVSETLDWARALVTLNAKSLDRDVLENTLTVLLKYEADLQRARRMLRGGSSEDIDRPAWCINHLLDKFSKSRFWYFLTPQPPLQNGEEEPETQKRRGSGCGRHSDPNL